MNYNNIQCNSNFRSNVVFSNILKLENKTKKYYILNLKIIKYYKTKLFYKFRIIMSKTITQEFNKRNFQQEIVKNSIIALCFFSILIYNSTLNVVDYYFSLNIFIPFFLYFCGSSLFSCV